MAVDPEELEDEEREEDEEDERQRRGRRRLIPENPIRWLFRRASLPGVSWITLRHRRRQGRR